MARNINSKFKILVLILGIILFFFLLYSFFIDEIVEVVVEIEIDQPREIILKSIYHLPEWENWSVWNAEYYKSKILKYKGNQLKIFNQGNAVLDEAPDDYEMLIEARLDNDVSVDYFLKELHLKVSSHFQIKGSNPATVVWSYHGDYSQVVKSNPLRKYFLLFTHKSLKEAHQKSLQGLKKYLEKNK